MNVLSVPAHRKSVLGLNNGGGAPSTGRQGALWPTGTEPLWVKGAEAFGPGACLPVRCAVRGANELSSLSRITDQRYEKVPYFVFGDFNFRLDSKRVIEVSSHDTFADA